MSTYGRNFEFRVQPHGGQRSGRYINPADGAAIPIGAAVVADTASGRDTDGRLEIGYASASTEPVSGVHGIAVYEYAPNAFSGNDPLLTTYSDKDTIPVGKACYLVSGDEVVVVLRNTDEVDFYGQRTYDDRKMVDGLAGATPSVTVGEYLEPVSSPSDTNGYWQVTATKANAWLVVTAVDNTRQEVEARFMF